jgi:DNA-directed RNA polymerase subunit F
MDYEAERAVRFCAEAFLDPEAVKRGEFTPIGSLEEWREKIDGDIIQECWRQYSAIRVAYDPVSYPLSQEDLEAIDDVIKKKAADPARSLRFLRLFGVRRLSNYLLHSADRLFPSVTPTSTPSEPSPDTSAPS